MDQAQHGHVAITILRNRHNDSCSCGHLESRGGGQTIKNSSYIYILQLTRPSARHVVAMPASHVVATVKQLLHPRQVIWESVVTARRYTSAVYHA